MIAKANVQLACGNGDADLEAEARPAVMGAYMKVGWTGLWREEGRPRGTQCSQETAVPVVKPWLLASNKLPDSEPHDLSAGPFPVQTMRGTRLCEDPLALGCRMPTLTPWGADTMFPLRRFVGGEGQRPSPGLLLRGAGLLFKWHSSPDWDHRDLSSYPT